MKSFKTFWLLSAVLVLLLITVKNIKPIQHINETGSNIVKVYLIVYDDNAISDTTKQKKYKATINIHYKNNEYTGDCYIRRSGHSTLESVEQPSFHLYSDDRFRIPMFEGMDSYSKLILKNSGNDYGLAFVRNQLAQSIAYENGFKDSEQMLPCEVWINDKYMGYYQVVNVLDETWFADLYDTSTEHYRVYKNLEDDSIPDDLYKCLNMTTENFDEELVENTIDVHQFLEYIAWRMWCGDRDVITHNTIVYSIDNEPYKFILHDMDKAFFTHYDEDATEERAVTEGIGIKTEIDNCTHLAVLLMRNEDNWNYFKDYMLQISSHKDSYIEKLYQLHEERLPCIKNMFDNNLITIYRKSDKHYNIHPSIETTLKEIKDIEDYIDVRPTYINMMLDYLDDYRFEMKD